MNARFILRPACGAYCADAFSLNAYCDYRVIALATRDQAVSDDNENHRNKHNKHNKYTQTSTVPTLEPLLRRRDKRDNAENGA